MRIVFLTHNFPRRPGDVSGVFLTWLGRALLQRGHEVRVIAPADEGWTGSTRYEGMVVRRVRYAKPEDETLAYRGTMADAARTVAGMRTLRRLHRALRAAAREEMAAADVLHAHWWVPGGLAAPPESRYVLTVHGTDAAILNRSALARALARPVIHRAKVVTAVSNAVAEIIRTRTRREVLPHKVKPMPADTSRIGPGQEPGAGLVVLARLTSQKRIHLAIEAAALIRDQGRAVPLLIAGDGPERHNLEQRVAALDMTGHVEFCGAVPPEEVGRLLAPRAVMVFPAEQEGFGLVAAEAFMAGVSVVGCRDGGGVLDIVPGGTGGGGRVVDPTAAAIASAITELLDHPRRHADALELGEEWRRRLDPAVVAAQCEEWYYEALRAT